MPQDRYVALARASLGFLSLLPHLGERPALVLKLPSQLTRYLHRWHLAAPDAICLNMHREALGWANSQFHFVQRLGLPPELPMDARAFNWKMLSADTPANWLDGLLQLEQPDLHYCELSAAAWALNLEWLSSAKASGLSIQTLHYEDLLADRNAGVLALIQAAGLSAPDMAASLAAFDNAAHDGAGIYETDKAISLTPAQHDMVRAVLASPRLNLAPDSRPWGHLPPLTRAPAPAPRTAASSDGQTASGRPGHR